MIPEKCERDAKGQHYWQYLGLVPYKNKVYKIFECTQCKIVKWNELNFNYDIDKME